jgi:hypothetical protein
LFPFLIEFEIQKKKKKEIVPVCPQPSADF